MEYQYFNYDYQTNIRQAALPPHTSTRDQIMPNEFIPSLSQVVTGFNLAEGSSVIL